MTTPKPPPGLEIDPDAPPSEGELRAAAALRDALADPAVANEDAELLRALSLAESPRPLGAEEHRAIVERALATRKSPARPTRGLVIRVAFGAAAAALAVAAAVVLLVQPSDLASKDSLARVRSTQPLFHEPFARQGGESARVDRIAMARASDLRDNEFRRWGAR